MVFEFKLPDIGEGVHEGEISRWLVKPGDPIAEDAPMVEVMTDKVTVEITAPVAGTVEKQLYKEGDTVKVGSVIITIAESGAAAPKPTATEMVQKEGNAPAAQKNGNVATALPPAMGHVGSSKALAAPAVRKYAREVGVDLAAITGSGPRGRVRKEDVDQASSGKPAVASAAAKSIQPSAGSTVPYTGIRRKIGEHLSKSKQTVPHFTYVEEADFTELVCIRAELSDTASAQGVKLTYLPFIIKAVIEGLKQYPTLNSQLDDAGQQIKLLKDYNIGVAVATHDGLIVPVIHQADKKSIRDIAAELVQLSQKARDGKLALSDLQGGTFTLTSIGSIGGIFSAPIINVPEVAIMGIQKIEKRPVVRSIEGQDQIVIREMSYLSISCDHRVVDGAEAAYFMKEVIGWLEQPSRLLLV